MKPTVTKILIPLMLVSAAAAQDGDAVDQSAKKAPVVDVDNAAATRPVLLVERARITVIGTPHAIVAVFASAKPGDTEIAPVRVLLGCGALDAYGRFMLKVPPVDTDTDIDDGVSSQPILLQALQLRRDGRIDVSPIAQLLRRPSAETVDLKLDNTLGQGFEVKAELSSTDSLPPQFHLHLAVRVPTTGYRLRLAARADHGDHIELRYELVEPDPAMRQLTVLETLHLATDLGAASGAIEVTIRKVAFGADGKTYEILR